MVHIDIDHIGFILDLDGSGTSIEHVPRESLVNLVTYCMIMMHCGINAAYCDCIPIAEAEALEVQVVRVATTAALCGWKWRPFFAEPSRN